MHTWVTTLTEAALFHPTSLMCCLVGPRRFGGRGPAGKVAHGGGFQFHSPGAITGAAEKEARQVLAVPATSRGAKWTAAEWQNRPAEPRGLVPTEYRRPPILTSYVVGVGGHCAQV